MLTLTISTLVVLYTLYIVLLIYGWHRTSGQEFTTSNNELLVTVIVPTRNEASNVSNLLTDLSVQDYPSEKFQVLVVDDYSEDQTALNSSSSLRNLRIRGEVLSLRELNKPSGKKSAISVAVEHTTDEVIICTDADCRVGSGWIRSYVDYFNDEQNKLVLGAVKFEPVNTFFAKLQQLEFAGLIGLGAASLKLGVPNMCNGANMGYRKSLFEKIGGYAGNENIPSGDDEFLLQKAYDKYPKGVVFQNYHSSVVNTTAKKNLTEFINQRIRWAGKWKYHSQSRMVIWAFSMFLFQASLIMSLLIGIATFNLLIISILLVRTIVEFVYLQSVCKRLQIAMPYLQFLVIQLLYPFYIIILSIISMFGTYQWKGRSYS